MSCQIVTTAPLRGGGAAIVYPTNVDAQKTDTQNVDDHIDGLALQANISSATSASTTWPGLPSPVVTTRYANEPTGDFLARHRSACLTALLSHEIDCP